MIWTTRVGFDERAFALRMPNSVPMTSESPRTPSADAAAEEVAMVPNGMRRRGSWRIAGDLPASFRYAAQGLGYAFVTQRNFRIHVVTGLVVFGLAAWLQLDLIRLAVLVLTVAAVLVLELLNTAMEAVVDLAIGRRYHPLARIAKDCAAAAVLTAAISSLLIAVFLLLPPLLLRLGL